METGWILNYTEPPKYRLNEGFLLAKRAVLNSVEIVLLTSLISEKKS